MPEAGLTLSYVELWKEDEDEFSLPMMEGREPDIVDPSLTQLAEMYIAISKWRDNKWKSPFPRLLRGEKKDQIQQGPRKALRAEVMTEMHT